MSFLVRKSYSVLVVPSEPVSMSDTIKLSPSEKALDNQRPTALLVFEHPIHKTSETIKRALSQALVHYYPIAGRFVAGAGDDDGHILCNGAGVAFVAASASCALKEVMFSDRRSPGVRTLLDQLAVYYPAEGFGPIEPLLLMQVTEFSCGGFVLGVTWNHAIADAAGMAQFLQAIGELARGLSSPSVAPVRCDDSLPTPLPFQQLMANLDPFHDLAHLDINVPSRSINRIRAEFGSRFNGQPCTMFEAVSAVIWQCRTRAIMSNPDAPALFSFAANTRKYVGAKQGYYGNCITLQLIMATSSMVASGDIIHLVKMIKDSKEKIPEQFKNNECSNQQQAIGQQQLDLQDRYNLLIMSSWRNLSFEEADFGSGKPARVTSCVTGKLPFPVSAMLPPCKGSDGVNVLSAIVKEEHADAFLGELARFV